MVYKIINEWFSEEKDAHSLVICKYNISHEEMIMYYYQNHELTVDTQIFGGNRIEQLYDTRDGEKKWWNYK